MRGLGGWLRRITAPLAAVLARFPWLAQTLLLLRRAVTEFRDDHCSQLAAAISFHLLFSLFPLAIATVGIVGLLTRDPHAHEAVVSAILKVVPLSGTGGRQLRDLLASVSGGAGALGLLGLAGVVWSASGVMSAIRTALNLAWDTDAKRPFARGKLVDLALIAGVFLVTGATLALSVAAGLARQGVTHLPAALSGLAGTAVTAMVFIVSVALLFSTFALMYRLVPAARTRLGEIWPGALAAAVGFAALQYGFSVYLAHFAHYNKVYGSLGAVIAFLFFVYLASMVFLFGAEVASEYPRLPPAEARPATPGTHGKPRRERRDRRAARAGQGGQHRRG